MVGTSNQPMFVFKSESTPFQLRNVTEQHIFLPVKFVPIYLIGETFETHGAHISISFSQKGELYLELNGSDAEQVQKIMIFKGNSVRENLSWH